MIFDDNYIKCPPPIKRQNAFMTRTKNNNINEIINNLNSLNCENSLNNDFSQEFNCDEPVYRSISSFLYEEEEETNVNNKLNINIEHSNLRRIKSDCIESPIKSFSKNLNDNNISQINKFNSF